MKYAVKTDTWSTTSADRARNIVAHVTIVKVPWWKRVLKVKP